MARPIRARVAAAGMERRVSRVCTFDEDIMRGVSERIEWEEKIRHVAAYTRNWCNTIKLPYSGPIAHAENAIG